MCVQNKSPVNQDLIGTNIVINKNILNRKSKKYTALLGESGVIWSVYTTDRGVKNYGVEIRNIRNDASAFGFFYFKPEEFDIQTDENEKEHIMNVNNYKGKFRIVLIQFLDGTKYEVNYRIYDDGFDYKEGDLVIVKPAHHDMTIAKIKKIYDSDSCCSADENREVVCPIDISKYQERNNKAEEIVKLKREMDKKVKELQGVALYELMAQHSPELRDMLTQFKELTGVEASVDKLQDET